MAKLAHGMPIPPNIKFLNAEEEEAIILEYDAAYCAANGESPNLYQLDDGKWKIGSMKDADAVFFVFEFPWMTKTLWTRAEQQERDKDKENRTGHITALFKRLMPVNIHEVIAHEFQTSERG